MLLGSGNFGFATKLPGGPSIQTSLHFELLSLSLKHGSPEAIAVIMSYDSSDGLNACIGLFGVLLPYIRFVRCSMYHPSLLHSWCLFTNVSRIVVCWCWGTLCEQVVRPVCIAHETTWIPLLQLYGG